MTYTIIEPKEKSKLLVLGEKSLLTFMDTIGVGTTVAFIHCGTKRETLSAIDNARITPLLATKKFTFGRSLVNGQKVFQGMRIKRIK